MAYLIKRGDVADMSFGFSVPRGGDSWSDDGATRELREVRLHEVSIVRASRRMLLRRLRSVALTVWLRLPASRLTS
jgi:hypothetical protein